MMYLVLSVSGAILHLKETSDCDEWALVEEAIDPTKPVYRRSQIKEHISKDLGVWVTHGNGVYDITKFMVNHPGGQDKIKLAAGGAVEPFWKIYRQHYNSMLAPNVMKPLHIGYLHPDDVASELAEQSEDSNDPYSADPQVRGTNSERGGEEIFISSLHPTKCTSY